MGDEILKLVNPKLTETVYVAVSEFDHALYKAWSTSAGGKIANWARAAINDYIKLLRTGDPAEVAEQYATLMRGAAYVKAVGKRKAIHFVTSPDEEIALLAVTAQVRATLRGRYGYEIPVKKRRGNTDMDVEALALLKARIARTALRYKAEHQREGRADGYNYGYARGAAL